MNRNEELARKLDRVARNAELGGDVPGMSPEDLREVAQILRSGANFTTSRIVKEKPKPLARVRPIYEIALEIGTDWKNVSGHADPYLRAMGQLKQMSDKFGLDGAEEVVARFLCNASSWHGPTARRIKKELNDMIKLHRKEKK